MKIRTTSSKGALKEEYKKVCKAVKKLAKSTRISYETQIILESKKNPKLIYAYINNQRTTIDKIKALLNENGELTSKNKEIVDLLNLKFHEAFTRDNGDDLPNF